MARSDPEVPPRRGRKWLRWVAFALVGLGVLHLTAWRLGWTKITTPGDVVLNLGGAPHFDDLARGRDGVRRLVVVLHGVGRSAWSMWKIERLLRAHGYEVWNRTYDGAAMTLDELGADLGRRLGRYLAAGDPGDGRPLELYAVAHSMGGLVLRSYARRPDARTFTAVVLLGTPNRGAEMARQLAGTWYFRFFLGSKAAAELSPAKGVVEGLGNALPCVGNVVGGRHDGQGWSSMIPGDDDGRVGVAETRLAGQTDCVLVPVSHTFLPTDDRVLRQVLYFLRYRRFARP